MNHENYITKDIRSFYMEEEIKGFSQLFQLKILNDSVKIISGYPNLYKRSLDSISKIVLLISISNKSIKIANEKGQELKETNKLVSDISYTILFIQNIINRYKSIVEEISNDNSLFYIYDNELYSIIYLLDHILYSGDTIIKEMIRYESKLISIYIQLLSIICNLHLIKKQDCTFIYKDKESKKSKFKIL